MYCLPIKGKSIEELSNKVSLYALQYRGHTIHEINFNTPTKDCEWYSCLLLIVKDDENESKTNFAY